MTTFSHNHLYTICIIIKRGKRNLMNNPLINIIVPVHNVEYYLPYCLDSIANQSYTNFEAILVDDIPRTPRESFATNIARKTPDSLSSTRRTNGCRVHATLVFRQSEATTFVLWTATTTSILATLKSYMTHWSKPDATWP